MKKSPQKTHEDRSAVQAEGYYHSKDAHLYYQVIGTGQPLVLLHGNGEDHTIFEKQIACFRQHYQLLLIDSRGHGNSSWGRRKLTIDLMAEDVKRILNHLHLHSVYLLGFSDGANIALQFAIAYPDYLRALVIVSGNIRPQGIKRWFYLLVHMQYRRWHCLEPYVREASRKKQLYGLMAFQPYFPREAISDITAPTLVIAGSRDIISRRHTIQIARLLPNSTIYIIKGATHHGLFRKAEAYNSRIQAFLSHDRHEKKGTGKRPI